MLLCIVVMYALFWRVYMCAAIVFRHFNLQLSIAQVRYELIVIACEIHYIIL